MARVEAAYVDPSALLKLYVHQAESAAVGAWRARTPGALAVTHHGRVEIVNAICLAAFRGAITHEAMRDALDSFDEDFAAGRCIQADLLWRAALQRAAGLSRKHTPLLGCRTLDVLHVACALELGLRRFLTFDERQRQLARSAGLRPVMLPKARSARPARRPAAGMA
ncbi:MAG: type II toxin-antitoxin system VapC family toxin [Pseudomonadota bacterium]